jgi:hypothetical protein
MRVRVTAILTILMATGCAAPEPQPGQATTAPSRPAAKVVEPGPGIRIDFRVPQVEIESRVILREGPLELFAYAKSPTPKEHESVLKTDVSPEVIYGALGLVGLRPGHTTRYFPETQKVRYASGDEVEVLVRYQRDGKAVEESACGWMRDMQTKKAMKQTRWLFSGSERLEDGAFQANIEGTVVTVVDFPSSLLSLGASHSSSDAELWLTALTEAIPAIGTPVTLILRPVPSKRAD